MYAFKGMCACMYSSVYVHEWMYMYACMCARVCVHECVYSSVSVHESM